MTDPDRGRPLLAFDTATSVGGVAIGHADHVLAEVLLDESARHAENLLPAIAHVLSSAGCTLRDLAAVVVGAGPGSFTGVRIAAATAKALVYATGAPLHAWSSLAMVAAGCRQPDQPVVALFDARRSEVYAACYRFRRDGLHAVLPPTAAPVDDLLVRVPARGALFVGEGAILHADRIQAAGGQLAAAAASTPRPAHLLWLAGCGPDGGRIEDPSAWEPDYVRASGARRMWQP